MKAIFIISSLKLKLIIAIADIENKVSGELRRKIKRQWKAEPIIKAHKTHKKWVAEETADWQLVFNRRTLIERVFGRMKNHRRLNNITVRSR